MISIFESYIRNSRDPYTISIINNVTVSMYSVIGMAKPISIHFYREEKLVELSKRASRTTHDDCPLLLATHPERCARLSASSLSCIQRTFRITCSPHGRNHDRPNSNLASGKKFVAAESRSGGGCGNGGGKVNPHRDRATGIG